MKNLQLIPEDILKGRLPQLIKSYKICTNCKKAVDAMGFPYAYDSDNHEVIYALKCPICKNIIYTKE